MRDNFSSFLKHVAAAFLLLVSAPLAALPMGAPEEAAGEAASAVAGDIAAPPEEGTDIAVKNRIANIFDELPSLAGVGYDVQAGVVTLSGQAPDAEAIQRAENLAMRIDGVVTVRNEIERSATVTDGIGVLDGLADKAKRWMEMLPLIGLAALVGLLIALAGYAIAGFRPLWNRIAPNGFLAELIASAIRFIFAVLGIVVALDIIGAGALLGAVLGGAGVVGIALGFAMRDTIENYVASLMLSLRQPFRANDHVMIDDKEGRIIRLTSRATIMMTLDGNHLRIPNGQVFRAIILNFTTNPQRRFEFDLGVDADDDAQAARRLGRETLQALPFVLDHPPAEARIVEVGDSNVLIRFMGWVDQREADFIKAQSRAIPAVKVALEDAGFGLPEPIYRLRFDPRTTPLPFSNIKSDGSQKPDAPSKPSTRPATSSDPADDDVRPSDEIAEMVEAERAGPSQEADLLDAERPTE
ncbi:mechanosensitive ion channel domain-containing protein [Qipengyuania sp. DSG2-2]|uniref:mechanosensitive ion channel domain-containing protein n=1 Tax=Qipengyuania sp. DGS2-2 TaxID=3349631 RepID=UPI0036D41BA4